MGCFCSEVLTYRSLHAKTRGGRAPEMSSVHGRGASAVSAAATSTTTTNASVSGAAACRVVLVAATLGVGKANSDFGSSAGRYLAVEILDGVQGVAAAHETHKCAALADTGRGVTQNDGFFDFTKWKEKSFQLVVGHAFVELRHEQFVV